MANVSRPELEKRLKAAHKSIDRYLAALKAAGEKIDKLTVERDRLVIEAKSFRQEQQQVAPLIPAAMNETVQPPAQTSWWSIFTGK